MSFNSLQYLVFFAAVMVGAKFLPGRRPQQVFLTVASLYFYAAWNSLLVLIIVASALFDFVIARRMGDCTNPGRRKAWLMLSLTGNLGLLAFFKYSNFLLESLFTAQSWAGLGLMDRAPHLDLILPVGISFYTFQTLSYTVDVYRGTVQPVREFQRFLLFVSFFPQLVAGPIVRAEQFLPQLEKRAVLLPRNLQIGFSFFLVGLVKKVVFADGLAPFVEKIYSAPETFASIPIILATVSYAVQIYCDFSGYTDMAMGSAIALGFYLPKNFSHPYFARSVTEFWQRWHISLSTWLRDYLYIPLGGNRKGVSRTYINLMLVMALGGLWHGAKWTFVLWGVYQGGLLAIHRFYLTRVEGWPNWYKDFRQTLAFRLLTMAVTFYLVLVGWIFFRAESYADLQQLLQKFVMFDGFHRAAGVYLREVLFTAALVAAFFMAHVLSFRVGGMARRLAEARPVSWCAVNAVGLYLVLALAPTHSPEFIYFQF